MPRNSTTYTAVDLLLDTYFPARLAEQWVAQRADGSGLSVDEVVACSFIGATEYLTARRLSDVLAMPATTVSSMLARLEARGVLSSAPHPTDARSKVWALTAQGEGLRERIQRSFADAAPELSRHLAVSPEAVREHVVQWEQALRTVLGVARRTAPHATTHATVTLDVPDLTDEELADVRRYAEWVRARREQP